MVYQYPTTGLFSYHPPLQSLAILLFVQGVLTLQPTATKSDKARGLALHQIFQIGGLSIGKYFARQMREATSDVVGRHLQRLLGLPS